MEEGIYLAQSWVKHIIWDTMSGHYYLNCFQDFFLKEITFLLLNMIYFQEKNALCIYSSRLASGYDFYIRGRKTNN